MTRNLYVHHQSVSILRSETQNKTQNPDFVTKTYCFIRTHEPATAEPSTETHTKTMKVF